MVDIRLISELPSLDVVADGMEPKNFVTPGTIITKGTGHLRFNIQRVTTVSEP